MSSPPSPSAVAISLLASKDLQLQSLKVIQSLWAGYGKICHLTATPIATPDYPAEFPASSNPRIPATQEPQSFILKLITPPPTQDNDEGHIRKILSYQVEQYFYTELAPLLPASIPVAKCLASINKHHRDGTTTTAMILTDLRPQFPIPGEKPSQPTTTQVHAALDWLSAFHGFWWPHARTFHRPSLVGPPLQEPQPPAANHGRRKAIWLNGGYTYLATRRIEYNNLSSNYDSPWNEPLTSRHSSSSSTSLAEIIAHVLAPRKEQGGGSGWGPTEAYQTLIHGDVKSENFFTSVAGDAVAFYDFQYVGLGLGVSDLAKFFTCSVPLWLLVGDADTDADADADADANVGLGWELDMQAGERALLQRYLARVTEVSQREYPWGVFVRHWETALVDWCRFQASWGFWGNTEWLEGRVRWILKDERWREEVLGNWNHGQGSGGG